MRVKIEPGKLKGSVQAPPSKSYAHRMLICAALAEGRSELTGISSSEDMLATMDCVRALGGSCDHRRDVAVMEGIGRRGTAPRDVAVMEGIGHREIAPRDATAMEGIKDNVRHGFGDDVREFPCRESGSTLRFFIPIALAVCGGGLFTGTKRLMERGIGVYEEIFQKSGILVEQWNGPTVNKVAGESTDIAGLMIQGVLKPGNYKVRGDVSSQFITGLLFALSLLDADSTIEVLLPVESRAYIDITIDVMRQFGVMVQEVSENYFLIPGGQAYQPRSLEVEGDWSNGAFLYAFNAVGSELQIRGLNPESRQGDKVCTEYLEKLANPESHLKLTPGRTVSADDDSVLRIDISNTPDLGPVLFAAAAAFRGGHFTGTRRLRIKESDRAVAMKEELEKFGITCHVFENEVIVEHSLPEKLVKPKEPLKGHNDHRIVMALSILASLTGAEIEDAESVSKSWPDYFEVLKKYGLKVRFV